MKKHLKRIAMSLIGALILPLVVYGFDPYSPYDPYSGSTNSNFDFDNSVWTPTTPNTSGGSSGSGTGTGTGTGTSTGTKTTSTYEGNSPKTFPKGLTVASDSRGADVRPDEVYFLYVNEKVTYVKPDWTSKKLYYERAGQKTEVGDIQVTYADKPNYGYGQINKTKLFEAQEIAKKIEVQATSQDQATTLNQTTTTSPENTRNVPDSTTLTIPEDKTEIYVDSAGGVYNAETKEKIPEAHYDFAAHKIYYVDKGQITNSTYGTMLSQTRGYVNLDLRGMKKPVTLSPEPYKTVETFKFKDVPEGQYYTKPVTEAAKKGWLKKKDRFEPAKAMTRCEFATIVIKALSIPLAEEEDYFAGFKDVPQNHAAAPYVYTGVLKGYWKGQQDGSNTFACNKGLSRAEMAVILVRVLDLKEETSSYKPADGSPEWALPSIRKVHKAGLMKGLGDGKSWGAALTLSNADAITALFRVFGE